MSDNDEEKMPPAVGRPAGGGSSSSVAADEEEVPPPRERGNEKESRRVGLEDTSNVDFTYDEFNDPDDDFINDTEVDDDEGVNLDAIFCELGDDVEELRRMSNNTEERGTAWLITNLGHVPVMGGDPLRRNEYRRDFPNQFREFVMELERCPAVVKLDLEYANFALQGWDGPEGRSGSTERSRGGVGEEDDDYEDKFHVDVALQPDERDLDRLFGTVLPNHAYLSGIGVNKSRLQPRFLHAFAESAAGSPTFSMSSLTVDSTPLTAECGRLLKTMLECNVRVRGLFLWRCGLDADGWRLVCEGAAANRYLELLDLKDDIVLPPGTVVAALGPESTLSELHVAPRRWTRRAFVELVEALRVNTALKEISLSQKGGFLPAQADLVLDLLRTYNVTLHSVQLVPRKDGTRSYEEPIDALLQRNEGVRRAVEHLGSFDYRVPRRAVWPRALQELNMIPTLLYRFVRRGNVDAFAEHVVVRAPASALPSNGKRSRDQLQDLSDT